MKPKLPQKPANHLKLPEPEIKIMWKKASKQVKLGVNVSSVAHPLHIAAEEDNVEELTTLLARGRYGRACLVFSEIVNGVLKLKVTVAPLQHGH